MRRIKKFPLFFLCALCCLAAPVAYAFETHIDSIGNYQKAAEAWEVGNSEEAIKWYRKAAEQGHTDAQYELAEIYNKGMGGVPRDPEEALKWYLKAARIVLHTNAHYEIGMLRQNEPGAFHWFHRAATGGHAGAQYMLGKMYAEGDGVPKNLVLSLMWLELTVSGEHGEDKKIPAEELTQAKAKRDEVAKGMSPEDVATAMEKAKHCMGAGYNGCD